MKTKTQNDPEYLCDQCGWSGHESDCSTEDELQDLDHLCPHCWFGGRGGFQVRRVWSGAPVTAFSLMRELTAQDLIIISEILEDRLCEIRYSVEGWEEIGALSERMKMIASTKRAEQAEIEKCGN